MGNIRTFFEAIKVYLPSNYLITYPTTGYIIRDTDGVAIGSWSVAGQLVTGGTGAGGYSAPTGLHVDWRTGVLNTRGHQIKGRTFICPIVVGSYDIGGKVGASTANAVKAAADNLVTQAAQTLYVYARPGKTKAGVAYAGASAMVTTTNVPTKVAVLKSRRD
jgi:hypothetical protein